MSPGNDARRTLEPVIAALNGIVLGNPLQFFRVLHSARHQRIGIDGTIGGGLRLGKNLIHFDDATATQFGLFKAGNGGLTRAK